MVLISTASIAPAEDGTFSYSPQGSLALTLAVEDVSGDMADIVGWFKNPHHWWLRRGDQTPILGARALAIARWHGGSISLLSNPESWLRAHRPGGEADRAHCVCVLRWDVDLSPLFSDISAIHCETPALGRCLHDALHQFDPVIELLKTESCHAA